MRCMLTLLLLVSYSTGFSCYNEYYALDAKGHSHPIEMDQIRFNQAFDSESLEKQLIDWFKIKTNPERLLSYLGIKIKSPKKEKIESQKSDSTKEFTAKPKKKTDRSMLWIGLTIVVFVISIFVYFTAKKKKR